MRKLSWLIVKVALVGACPALVLSSAPHVALPVEAKPVILRWTVTDSKEVDAAQASASYLCFVETGNGKAKRRTSYILDFGGPCPAMDSAAHHEKTLRDHMSK